MFFAFLGAAQLFPDVDDQTTGTLPGLYEPPISPDSVSCVFVLVVLEISVISLVVNSAIGKAGCQGVTSCH